MNAEAIRGKVRGEVIEPTSPGFDEARALWNGMIDRRPALIVRCAGVDDVVGCVRAARELGVPLAVRGGGHNVAGYASGDGALVIDLSAMRDVRVVEDARLAVAQGGATLGDVDQATQAFGLATPLGAVSETGIAGLTLSGGVGWLRRKHGLSCDNLVAAEVVSASGDVVVASEDGDADLLWALRGGGGNFGVVTSFTYRLYPLGPEVLLCFVLYPGERAAEVLRAYERFMAEAPDEASPIAFLGRVPRADPFPSQWHGKPYVALAGVFAGDPGQGERVLQPLRELGEPIVDLSARMPYVEAQRALDEDYPSGWRYYWKSISLAELTDGAIERIVARAAEAPSDHSTIDVWYHGGAMARVGATETAFGDRSLPIWIAPEANWEHAADDDANVAWARAVVEDVRGLGRTGGAYLNFAGSHEDVQGVIRESFGVNYERLVELKRRFDPSNLFRSNQNIAP